MKHGEAINIWERNGLKLPKPLDECILFDNAYRLFEIEQNNADLLGVCKEAFALSCERSESRKKWTVKDQEVHDQLRQAISKAKKKK